MQKLIIKYEQIHLYSVVDHMNVSGKTIFITGSTDGLGKLVSKHLLPENTVLLHGRNPQKGKSVLSELRQMNPGSRIEYFNADFASLKEVSDLAENLKDLNIDILINNAAIGSGSSSGNKRELSIDGIELRFAVNYIAQVLLTEKLIKSLKPGSVIINVASVGQAKIDFKNLMLEEGYDGFFAYRRSKTALIMYTFDLAEKLIEKDIKVNAVHPASLMNTNMVLEDWGYTLSTVEQGAESVENLLSPPGTGAYYDMKQQSKAIYQAYDMSAREELRNITWELIKEFL